MEEIHFLDDIWVGKDDLKVSVFDLSVARGYGIFDFLRTYGNKPFRLAEHIDRLFISAKLLDIAVPKSKEEIEKIVYEGIEKNAFKETAIKIIVTGGISIDSITPGKPSFIVTFTKAPEYPQDYYTKGVKIITLPFTRFLPEVKSLDYFAAVVGMKKAASLGAKEVLYIDEEQRITECTRNNIFFVKNNSLVTPAEKGILKGITRKVVLEAAKKVSINVTEREITLDELPFFQEAFNTASTVEVLPVVTIDDTAIGDGAVGPVTKKIMKAFRDITSDRG
ncbi:MAG: aminotransferase class IV [Candidatus Levybacteria bacterium]|nr:aminotransferase class IV [Candidatus Levybacteria bacterium]